jgi:putative SOS response-associated peptidase YedK
MPTPTPICLAGGHRIALTDTMPTALEQDGRPRLVAARWGLVPFSAAGSKK